MYHRELFWFLPLSFDYLWAGGPSIIILIHRICIAFNGFGIPIKVASAIKDRAAMLVLNWNLTKFRILWKIPFPSSIAALKDICN